MSSVTPWRAAARALPLAAALVAVTVLSACASQDTGPKAPAGSFPGTSRWDTQGWVVNTLGGRELPSTGPRPTLAITQGVAYGTDGCNRYRRPLKPASDVPSALRFDEAGGISTRMACVGPAEDIAKDWNEALAATRSVRTEPKRLMLIDESGNVLVRLEPEVVVK